MKQHTHHYVYRIVRSDGKYYIGVTYQNGREAVSALGIPGSTLTYRLRSPSWLNYRCVDQPEKDPTLMSKRAQGEYTRITK